MRATGTIILDCWLFPRYYAILSIRTKVHFPLSIEVGKLKMDKKYLRYGSEGDFYDASVYGIE